MTRRAGEKAEDSATLRDLLDAGTETVCFVGKSWDVHVEKALRTDLDEGVAMVRDTVRHLRAQGRRVFFDAEHFFDGYLGNADSPSGCWRPPPRRAPSGSCSATRTAARFPRRSRGSWARFGRV